MITEKKEQLDVFLQFAETLAREAGALALRYYGQGDPRVKFDDELVIAAELAIRELILSSISERYPEHHLLGEGEDQTEYRHGERGFQWIVDPLDGTANFQAGIPVWGISLALFENFWPTLGVFYMPVSQDLYKALAGRMLMVNDITVEIGLEVAASNESVLLTYSRFHSDFRATFPGKIRSLGCTAAHLCYVASGRAEAALMKNVRIWDLAAGITLLGAGGGEIRYLDGRAFHLNEYLDSKMVDRPLLAAPAGEHTIISQFLQPL
ncbi:MAG: inositol monophosphatase family protein [Syntrophobacteria bacterium]